MNDYLFRGSLAEVDPDVYELTQVESERQYRKLILIPSESTAPGSVRTALGSTFQNLYAEGFPDDKTRWMSELDILDYPARLAHYRRYSDPRYYKGVEYADVVEALARRRCAELFATPQVPADHINVNVQPLSGAPANNAVYTALLQPGDTVMGMDLLHGGHLTHGSPVNRSGLFYNFVHYSVDPSTEQINYDAVAAQALATRPKIIIAGYSSYPWIPDWSRFRAIADSVNAVLMADVSHIAGLIAAGEVPSPVGHAHIITFTTHKTLCGPRGACILTDNFDLAKIIDRAVFPGEQGGPHVHVFAALAVTFKLARSKQFQQLQHQIMKNCQVFTNRLRERGLRIAFGGTDSHLGNVDCKSITGPEGTPLSGDMAVRILDIAGLVLNRNTLPGDLIAAQASGVRYGTPWVTQRGFKEAEMVKVADIMADVMTAAKPYVMETFSGKVTRAKIDFDILENAKIQARNLAESAGIDTKTTSHSYPHFYYLDDKPHKKGKWIAYDLKGERIIRFLNYVCTSDVEILKSGESQKTLLVTPKGSIKAYLTRVSSRHFRISVASTQAAFVSLWLRDLSDAYVSFDADFRRRVPGPVTILESLDPPVTNAGGIALDEYKPFAVGLQTKRHKPLPTLIWKEKETGQLRRTLLFDIHKQSGAKIVPFAGWEMPVWYTSVVEEHLATRNAAGLFDVSHMGVFQVDGAEAVSFLDSVCGNDIGLLRVGESCYTHFLDPDANVIDDTIVYRYDLEKYLVVVNASNEAKDWNWLTSVHSGKVRVDKQRPWAKVFGRYSRLRNLKDLESGKDMRIDLALQGPKSLEILLSLGCDLPTSLRIKALKRTELCQANVGGFDLVVSRTGYTGEKLAFELFVHPDQAVDLWKSLMDHGISFGLKPCGLGARDSLRTEAGLPLYGHEMGGDLNLGVAEAGFGAYIKTYKPWFIGRHAFMQKEKTRQGVVARFRFNEKGVRMAHSGDPVVDQRGRVIGVVTSCAIDSQGFLTGQAYVDLKSSTEGTPIGIFQGAAASPGKAPSDVKIGERVLLPGAAMIISRFPV